MNNISMICFEHNMNMIEIERDYMRNMMNLEYRSGILNEDTEVVYEGVFETIKNAILTVLRKIKEFFTNIIDFLKKGQDVRIDNQIKNETRKSEEVIQILKNAENKTSGSSDGNVKQDEKKPVLMLTDKRQQRIDANDKRNFDREKRNNGVISLDAYTEFKLFIMPHLPGNAGSALYASIINSDLYNGIDSGIRYVSRAVRRIEDTKRKGDHDDYLDYENEKNNLEKDNNSSNRLAFVNNIYKEYCNTLRIGINFTPTKDIKTLNFPEETKNDIFDKLNKTENHKTSFSSLPQYIKAEIEFAHDVIEKCSTKNLEMDIKKSRDLISKLENDVKKINNKDIVMNDFKFVYGLTNTLSHCLTTLIPIHRSVLNTTKSHSLQNLKTLNSLVS